jgi:hypothetical protein
MPLIGERCWRDATGAAALSLPWRVVLPDGSTRTDPSQWSADSSILAATGWSESTLTANDLTAMFPPPPPPDPFSLGWQTPGGWRLAWQPMDVALLTGLYVLAARATQLGYSQPIVVTDTAGHRHTLTFSEFEPLMLAYGAARAALSAGGDA